MITVTINVRDLDPTGPVPTRPMVSFARLTPSTAGGVLVTTEHVLAPLNSAGQGSIQLAPATAYEVRCYGISGFNAPFAVLTGTADTSLAALWQTGQVNPNDLTSQPVPRALADLLAASVPVALTQAAYDALPVKNPATLYLITT